MYAFQRFSCPSCFHPSTNRRMYRLLSKGLIGDPCGVPRPSSLLDVAQGMGLRAMQEVRFARGTARKSRWCAVEHRVIDWASHSPFHGESEVVIMIAVVTEEMHGSDRQSDLN